GEGEAGGGAPSGPAGADREAAPASDDEHVEEHMDSPDNQPPETSAESGSDVGAAGDEDAEEQRPSTYKPSRAELLTLVRHWFGGFLDIRLFEFFHATTGSSEYRGKLEANSNLERLAEALGPEVVQTVVGEVAEEARRRIGEEDWRVFTRGSPEERQ